MPSEPTFPSPVVAAGGLRADRVESAMQRLMASSRATPQKDDQRQQAAPLVEGSGHFTVGQRVRMVGLVARPDWNGLEGEVQGLNEETGRWRVALDNGDTVNAKPNNMEAVQVGKVTSKNHLAKDAMVKAEELAGPPELRGESEALSRIFGALDLTVAMYASRRRKASLSAIREDVQAQTSLALTEARLEQILALSRGAMFATWLGGSGDRACLELGQRCEGDQERRPPRADELAGRRAAFDAALAQASAAGPLPREALPPRPAAPERDAWRQRMGEILELQRAAREHGSAPAPQDKPSQTRLEALRRRTRAREVWDGVHAAAVAEREALRKRLLVCEDAFFAVGVLSALFARRKGALGQLTSSDEIQQMLSTGKREESAAVSEAEALTALCVRSGRPTDKATAREALAHLLGHSRGWFSLDVSHFGRAEVRNLVQIPGGGPSEVLASLRAERAELERRQAEDVTKTRIAVDALEAAAVTKKRAAEDNNLARRPLRRLRQKTSGESV